MGAAFIVVVNCSEDVGREVEPNGVVYTNTSRCQVLQYENANFPLTDKETNYNVLVLTAALRDLNVHY